MHARLEVRPRWGRRALALSSLFAFFSCVVGRLPARATVAEQRARLPPPAECSDPVAGLWKSHKWDETYQDWTIFTLEVRRDPATPGALFGRIENHQWQGTPEDEAPHPCRPGQAEWVVSMDARGSIAEDGTIHFGGVGQWREDRIICNYGPGGYNLDNFSGVIDRSINEFQSVNNDGGRAVNDPMVFRRISCFSDPPAAHAIAEPPPFFPRAADRGCSRW